jgi:hypothetical protein
MVLVASLAPISYALVVPTINYVIQDKLSKYKISGENHVNITIMKMMKKKEMNQILCLSHLKLPPKSRRMSCKYNNDDDEKEEKCLPFSFLMSSPTILKLCA